MPHDIASAADAGFLDPKRMGKDGRPYGCHVDLDDGEAPDGCVVDYGTPSDCTFGILPSGRPRRSKWTCPHWRPIVSTPQIRPGDGKR